MYHVITLALAGIHIEIGTRLLSYSLCTLKVSFFVFKRKTTKTGCTDGNVGSALSIRREKNVFYYVAGSVVDIGFWYAD